MFEKNSTLVQDEVTRLQVLIDNIAKKKDDQVEGKLCVRDM